MLCGIFLGGPSTSLNYNIIENCAHERGEEVANERYPSIEKG